MEKTIYYKVFKVFRKSQRREILRRNLTEDEAKRVVNSYPDSTRLENDFLNSILEDYFTENGKLEN